MTITRHEWVTLVLILVFGLVGWWLYSISDFGELLGTLCALPPAVYYLAFIPKDQASNS